MRQPVDLMRDLADSQENQQVQDDNPPVKRRFRHAGLLNGSSFILQDREFLQQG